MSVTSVITRTLSRAKRLKIRHISICNFRGIRELDWDIATDIVCLVGPGDSTKTTILDAIAAALSPNQFIGVNDADFYEGDVGKSILIEVTVTDPPMSLLLENKFGLAQRGWSAEKGVIDEPESGSDPALTIQLRVDASLEPLWTIVKQAKQDEGSFISARDRATLQTYRVDESVNNHLGWGRSSALSALTGTQEEIAPTIAAAQREARSAVFDANLTELSAAAAKAEELAAELGVPAGDGFQAGLDQRRALRAWCCIAEECP